jgi:hypothetical protein
VRCASVYLMRTLPQPPGSAAATPTASAETPTAAANPQPIHESDPHLAAALFAAWSGDRVVCVASPPGAGKTTLITRLAEQLHRRAGLNVAIAAQTRAQALDVANRTAAVLGAPPAGRDPMISLLGKGSIPPVGLSPLATHRTVARLREHRGIVVATTARWQWTDPQAWRADVLLIDEAWQLTYHDLLALGPLAPQIVCVGDPGQISPVVTGSTQRWQTWGAGPHTPAPDALASVYGDEVTKLRLPHTWRLGPETTALLQPTFYADLPFTSARPQRWLETDSGARLPELHALNVVTTAGHHDAALPVAAAERVRELLNMTTHTSEAGSRTGRGLSVHDVAVITPHVGQASAVAAHLADLPGILVSTANAAQGLEREAVVVIHPLAGYRSAPEFATDAGRLCVALSRHRTHATVICDPHTPTVLRRALREDPQNATLHAQEGVLAALSVAE